MHADLQKAAAAISATLPNLAIADMQTPHITIYYLDEQSQSNLQGVETIARQHANLLAGSKIELGHMGLFGGEHPRVVYLRAACSEGVYKFHDNISNDLRQYRATDNDFGFVPHVTLGRINKRDRQGFLEREGIIRNTLEKVDASFEVRELGIYGVDSRIIPERQTQIITIPI